MKRTGPPTEFEWAAAKRAVARLMPLIAQLSPADQERLEDIAAALLVATNEEEDILQALIDDGAKSDKYEHIADVARGIVAKHRKDDDE